MPRLTTVPAGSGKGGSPSPSASSLLRLKWSPLHLRQLVREMLHFLSQLLYFPAGVCTRPVITIVDCIQRFQIGVHRASLLYYQGILRAVHVLVQSPLHNFHCLQLNGELQGRRLA